VPWCMLMIDRAGVFETSTITHRTTGHTITQYRRHSRERASGTILQPHSIYRGAGKFLARTTSRCILFDGENISFDANLVIYI
jgi:hypothetical protein